MLQKCINKVNREKESHVDMIRSDKLSGLVTPLADFATDPPVSQHTHEGTYRKA